MTRDVTPPGTPRARMPVERSPQCGTFRAQATDLIRTWALSEAALRDQVLGRLRDIETELNDLVATIQVSCPTAVVAAPTAPVGATVQETPTTTDGDRATGARTPQRPPVWTPSPAGTSTSPAAPAPAVPTPAPTAPVPVSENGGGAQLDERVSRDRTPSPPPVWVPTHVGPAAPPQEHAPEDLVQEDPAPPEAHVPEAPVPLVEPPIVDGQGAGPATTRQDEAKVVTTGSRIGGLVRVLQVLAICITAVAALVLAAVVIGPRFLPYRALIVRSGSMHPTIPTGSVAFYRQEKATQVRVGQIILFSEPGDANIWITHRVVRIGDGSSGRFFITKGDANALPDPWRVPAEGTGWVVSYHVPYIGYALSALSDGWARWVLIALPAFCLAFLLLLQLVKGKQGKRAPPETQAA